MAHPVNIRLRADAKYIGINTGRSQELFAKRPAELLELLYILVLNIFGAGNGVRTRDPQLGRLML